MRPKRYLQLILSSSSYRSLLIILSDLLASISPEVTQERIGISFSSFLRYFRRAKRYCLACLFDISFDYFYGDKYSDKESEEYYVIHSAITSIALFFACHSSFMRSISVSNPSIFACLSAILSVISSRVFGLRALARFIAISDSSRRFSA